MAGAGFHSREPARRYRAAAICPPGLEPYCRQELVDLGCRPKPAGAGTVEFEASARQIYAANLWLRTASRVVVRLATFRSTDFAHLEQHASGIEWSPWLADGVAPSFRITSNRSKLYHTGAIAQRLHQVAGPPSQGQPEQLFVVRIERNNVTVSVDSSGDALHRRPWRAELGRAPLRATMAAAMLLAAQWDPSSGLVDPFCGSGTIAIEAALLARRMPPGGDRPFAFQTWPGFEPGTWASVKGQAALVALPSAGGSINASDRDAAIVASAAANAERAGVSADLEIGARVVSHLKAVAGPGLVATNPPYGKRMASAELERLYRRFGSVVNQRLDRWALALLCPDRALAAAADNRLRPVARFRHGGLPVELFYRGAPVGDEAPAGRESGALSGPAQPRRPPRSEAQGRQPSPTTSRPR
jgi:putative N6-adenine-specific DNA methylase